MKKTWMFVAALYTSSTALFAQADSLQNTLDEVVVTATKSPKKISETGKVLTIISREQLERSAGKDLSQLLNEQTGIIINGANSNPGKDKSVFLRGAKSDYTLILIDGVPVYDASGSSANFDLRLIPIETIDRIEILKGSQGTMYGADAIAGVINIITKKSGTKAIGAFANISYGSYNTLKANAGINGKTSKVDYNIAYTYFDTKGISEAVDKSNAGNFDKDGYKQNSFLANLGFQAAENWKVSPYIRFSKFNGNLDNGSFADDKDYTYNSKNLQAGIRNEIKLNKTLLYINYNFNTVERNYLDDSLLKSSPIDGYYKGNYKGQEHFIDAYFNIPLSKEISFTGGIDYRTSNTDIENDGVYKYYVGNDIFSGSFSSAINSDSAKQNQIGAYGAFLYHAQSGFNAEIGGRYNRHSVYGNNAVFNINPSYLINNQFKIFANISSGYKVPTLYQLYSEYRNTTTTLKPEKSLTYEAGLQYFSADKKITVRGTIFKRDITDAIIFYTNPITYASYYLNQDKQNDKGAEIEAVFTINDKLQLNINYAYVDGKVSTKNGLKDTSFFNLTRRPKNTLGAALNYQVSKAFFIGINAKSFGKRTDFDYSIYAPVELDKYFLLNAYASFNFSKKFKFFVDAKNITDEKFTEVIGYSTQGATVQAGISIKL